jgi:hypothetical protein
VPKLRRNALVALLVAERRRAGLSQIAVAKKLRKQPEWMSHIETGRRQRVSVIEFLALAEAIGFDPAKAVRKLQRLRSKL